MVYEKNRKKGSTLLLFTLTLPVLLGLAGLAIDLTAVYIAQAQLQTAVDGAAHGSVRLIKTEANTTEIAGEFLKANMPSGYWFTTKMKSTDISVTTVGNKNTVKVSATAEVALFFLQVFGRQNMEISAGGSASNWELVPCDLGYPYGAAPSLSAVDFNESIIFAAYGPTFVQPHGSLMVWYNDEHPITLGVYKVIVKTSAGTTTTDFSNSFTFFNGTLAAVNLDGPLPVGTTKLTGPEAGTDDSTWNQFYGYLDNGRPMWPSLFVTDITSDAASTAGDWQQGGSNAIAPNAIYGPWKGAVRMVDYTKTPAAITITPDADGKTKTDWTGVPDTPPGGFPKCDGYCSELVWNVDSLGLKVGHTYRMQFIIHDGDQNRQGGDAGQGCAIVTY